MRIANHVAPTAVVLHETGRQLSKRTAKAESGAESNAADSR